MYFVHFPAFRGKNPDHPPLYTLANWEKARECGTHEEFIAPAVPVPSSRPAGSGWRGPGSVLGLHGPGRQVSYGSMAGSALFVCTAGRKTRSE